MRLTPSAVERMTVRINRRTTTAEWPALVLLIGMAIVLGALYTVLPDTWPLSGMTVPLVLASVMLGPRSLPWFVVLVMTIVAFGVTQQNEITPRIVVGVAVIFLVGLVVMLASFRRAALGVGGMQGESMLVDLRDRILGQGRLPPLPQEWYVESALRSAGGTPFAGDFVVAVRRDNRLDLVVVDVSGKGEGAGTRALLLSGAFGGLLGALPPGDFLPAANDYLVRQGWEEGFATAVHLSLDLCTGDFQLRAAGHPPAVQLSAGSGRWTTLEAEGPALGLVEGMDFDRLDGRIELGDAFLLFTDGMVETPTRDVSSGIDRLTGHAERLFADTFDEGARRLVDSLGSRNDDRALVMVHRR